MGESYNGEWCFIDYRDDKYDGRVLIQIDVEIEGKNRRLFITLPDQVCKQIDKFPKESIKTEF